MVKYLGNTLWKIKSGGLEDDFPFQLGDLEVCFGGSSQLVSS